MTATTAPAETVRPPTRVPRSRSAKAARRAGIVGGAILGFFAFLYVFGGRLAPYRATQLAGHPLQSPGGKFLLGTNLLGPDIASQLILGTRASLQIALLAGVGTVLLGGIVGVVAGWFPGWPNAVLMRFTDLVLVLPKLPLLLLMGALTGGSVTSLAIVISAVSWPTTARILRSQVLSIRTRTHVRAAGGFGAKPWHQMRCHVLPDIALLSVAEFVPAASRAIGLQAALAFLGVGDPTRPSWGSMIRDATNFRSLFLTEAWKWWLIPPVVALVALIVSITLVATAAEYRLSPRIARHQR